MAVTHSRPQSSRFFWSSVRRATRYDTNKTRSSGDENDRDDALIGRGARMSVVS